MAQSWLSGTSCWECRTDSRTDRLDGQILEFSFFVRVRWCVALADYSARRVHRLRRIAKKQENGTAAAARGSDPPVSCRMSCRLLIVDTLMSCCGTGRFSPRSFGVDNGGDTFIRRHSRPDLIKWILQTTHSPCVPHKRHQQMKACSHNTTPDPPSFADDRSIGGTSTLSTLCVCVCDRRCTMADETNSKAFLQLWWRRFGSDSMNVSLETWPLDTEIKECVGTTSTEAASVDDQPTLKQKKSHTHTTTTTATTKLDPGAG